MARRLGAESVGLVFAVREPAAERHLEGLTELVVDGLDDDDARALLETVITGPLDERVRDRIVAETRGNPLALLELPRGRTPAELAGGFGLADGPALSGRIEESFTERLAPLPPSTRLLLLVAAAEPVGDPLLVWSAAAALGLDAGAAAPATATGLVELGAQVRFAHPLVRSAVYRAAAPEDRQRVHRALAEATDAEVDPDRRAWHRAQATAGLDEDVAAELERSAGRARARGGLAAGAAFHERAAELTPDPRRRAQRALAAAQSKHQAGAPDAALRLLATAEAGPLDELERARAQLLRAQIAFATTRGRDAPPLLLAAAKRLEPLDATLARETYLEAFAAALSADRLVRGGDAREVAAAVLAADWEPSTRAVRSAARRARAALTTEGCAAGGAGVEAGAARVPRRAALRGGGAALAVAGLPRRPRRWATTRHGTSSPPASSSSPAGRARSPCCPSRSTTASRVELFAGRLAVATSLAAEADAVVEATGSHLTLRAAHRAGQLARARRRGPGADRGPPAGRAAPRRRALAHRQRLGHRGALQRLGRYDDALAAAERAAEDPHGLGLSTVGGCPSSSRPRCAAASPSAPPAPLARLAEIAEANGTDWALGIARARRARCSPRARPPSRSTARRSSGWPAPASASRWPARTCSTANGCGARTAASTRASSSASRTRCSPTWAWRRSPSAPAASCWPPARRCASARSRRSTT